MSHFKCYRLKTKDVIPVRCAHFDIGSEAYHQGALLLRGGFTGYLEKLVDYEVKVKQWKFDCIKFS